MDRATHIFSDEELVIGWNRRFIDPLLTLEAAEVIQYMHTASLGAVYRLLNGHTRETAEAVLMLVGARWGISVWATGRLE